MSGKKDNDEFNFNEKYSIKQPEMKVWVGLSE